VKWLVAATLLAAPPALAQEATDGDAPQAQRPAQDSSREAEAPPQPLPPRNAVQRVDENVVRQADDGFGATIGRETIGIYNAGSVRGFSPTRAGNIRVDGLYYDQVYAPNARIRRSSAIKVGLTTLGFAFPAPSGVVDYALRRPGGDATLSVAGTIDEWAGKSVEVDFTAPIDGDRLAIGGRLGIYNNEFYNGTDSFQHVGGLLLRWRPSPDIEILPFWQRSDVYDDQVGPIYIPAGDFLPPRIERRRYFGPDWATYAGTAATYGGLGRFVVAREWTIDAGIFRSYFDNAPDHFPYLERLGTDGVGRYTILGLPPARLASTSGELRLSRQWSEGPRRHNVVASASGRDRRNRFDGGSFVDFGPLPVNTDIDPQRPDFTVGPQSFDTVRQRNLGLAYMGEWDGVGQLSVGVSRADYFKDFRRPGVAPVETRATPMLYNATLAVQARPGLAFYAGVARGLEESGIAPQSAANRNEALPAILTDQIDAGLRLNLTDRIKLIGGVFELRRPYFTLDSANVFRELGAIRNRGLELSLSGPVTAQLDVAAGAVLLDPRVTGDAVAEGRTGDRPIDVPRAQLDANLDWRLPFAPGWSLDVSANYLARRPATTLNTVFLPARELLNLGARYRFRLAGNVAILRLALFNAFNAYGFDLRGAGAYDMIAGRRAQAYLSVDF
jgi:iron complex outermembrane recepter protein